MKKIVFAAAAAIALVAAWYFGSPRWTLYQMADAAEARDSDRLATYVDFPVLRETTKSQFKAQLMAQAAREGGSDGWGALGAMMGMALVDPLLDRVFTPEALRVAFAATPDTERAQSPERTPFDLGTDETEIVQIGFDEFRLRKKGTTGEEGDLIFRRHGLGWKFSEIRLPDDLWAKQAAN